VICNDEDRARVTTDEERVTECVDQIV